MGDSLATSDGRISLPIDYVDVGLLKYRAIRSMGLVTLDSAKISHYSLENLVKTAALRQVVEAGFVNPDQVMVFIRCNVPTFKGYVGRLTTPTTDKMEDFINQILYRNVPLQVEVWLQGHLSSPCEYYFQRYVRNGGPDLERDLAANVVRVELTELTFDNKKFSASSYLEAHLLTTQCVRAFRKDLQRRVVQATGRFGTSPSDVEIFFRRKTSHEEGCSMEKSKDAFEDAILKSLGDGKPLKVQYRMKPSSKEKSMGVKMPSYTSNLVPPKSTCGKTASYSVATPSIVQMHDKRPAIPSFGKASFGQHPLWTTPPAVRIPPSESSFSPFVRTTPTSMSDMGQKAEPKSLHETFLESLSNKVSDCTDTLSTTAAQSDAGDEKAQPTDVRSELSALKASMSHMQGDLKRVKRGLAEKSVSEQGLRTATSGGPSHHSIGGNIFGLRQVEAMLSTFMTNLNQSLCDNFGDDASTLSILRGAELDESGKPSEPSDKRPTPAAPAIRHNAICDLCNQGIMGTRYKCANCPDWDVCQKCRGQAAQDHPGHSFMTIKSDDIIPASFRVKSDVRHPGILCDGCDGEVVGARFKCIACNDFDWCQNCEANPAKKHDLGDLHIFLKIVRPVFKNKISHLIAQAKATAEDMQEQNMGSTVSVAQSKAPAQSSDSAETPSTGANNGAVNRTPANLAVHLLADEGLDNPKDAIDSIPTSAHGGSIGQEEFYAKDTVQQRLAALQIDAERLPGVLPVEPHTATFDAQLNNTAAVEIHSTLRVDERQDYDMEVVKDLNMQDGVHVVAGSCFDKTWLVKNTGRQAWPTTTMLRVTSSSQKLHSEKKDHFAPFTTPVQPGESVELSFKDVQAGEEAGDQHVYFRLQLPVSIGQSEGKRFGQQLWSRVRVVDGSSAPPSNSGSIFHDAATNYKQGIDQWNGQGSSIGSSLVQLPHAPGSEAAVSESRAPTEADIETSDSLSVADSDNFDDYEVIDPTTDGEDDDSAF